MAKTQHRQATNNKSHPAALTIAGSDSSGGAGLQADLKAFQRAGVFGCTAITAITAQNAAGVNAVATLLPEMVTAQIDAVMDGMPITAAKTGMLANADIVHAVVKCLKKYALPLVVDPVMIATSGSRLIAEEATEQIKRELLPEATLVTPNLPELSVLTGLPVSTRKQRLTAGRALLDMGCQAVLVKGGHDKEDAVTDILLHQCSIIDFVHPRFTGEFHGTGCTLSAAICARLAKGAPLKTAVSEAGDELHQLIRQAWKTHGGSIFYLALD